MKKHATKLEFILHQINSSKLLIRLLVFSSILLGFSVIASAQTTYTWNATAGGSYITASNWTPSRSAPAATDILIFSDGNTYTVTDVTTQNIGSLTVSSNTNVTFTSTAAATLTVGDVTGDDFIIGGGSTLNLGQFTTGGFAVNITLATNSTASITGTFNVQTGTYNTNGTSVVTTVNSAGIIRLTGTAATAPAVTSSTATKLIFNDGGEFNVNINSGSIPISTWNLGSTIRITGSTANAPANATQAFSNFIWDNTAQGASTNLSVNWPDGYVLSGNLTVNSTGTGTGQFRLTSFSAANGTRNITINGTMNLNGGITTSSGSNQTSTSVNVTIKGKVTINGGTLQCTANSNTPSIYKLENDFELIGGALTVGTSNGSGVQFIKAGTQEFKRATGAGSINTVPFTVLSGTTLKLGPTAIFDGGGTFNLNAGATLESGHSNGIAGNITTSGTKTYDPAASFTFNGINNQTATSLPTIVNNLSIANTGTLPNNIVSTAGPVTINGVLTVTSGVLNVATGTLALGTSGSGIIKPNAELRVATGAFANFNSRPFTIKTTAFGPGRKGRITDGAPSLLSASNVTVERFIGAPTAKAAWRLITAPLRSTTTDRTIWQAWQNSGATTAGPGTGTYVTGPEYDGGVTDNGLDANTPGPSVKRFNLATGLLEGVANTKTEVLFTTAANAANKGYFIFITGDRDNTFGASSNTSRTTTLTPNGALQAGAQTFTTNTGSETNTLIGNPYASPVDFDLLYSQNAGAQIKRTFYFWDPNRAGLNNVGGYVVVSSADNGATYTTAPWDNPGPAGGTVNNANYTRFIQSGQAIFLENNIGAAGGQNLVFQESQKSATSSVNDIFRTSTGTESFRVNLKTIEGTSAFLTDGIVAEFATNFAAGIDDIDANKFYNTGEGIAFMRNNVTLAIERRPTVQLNDTLFLNMKNMKPGSNYRFDFDGDFTAPGLVAFLQDSYNPGVNTPVSVNGNTTFNFTVTTNPASQAANRFRVVFRTVGPLPLTLTNVKAYQQNSNIAVEWKTENESRMKQYEVEKSVNGVDFARVSTVAAQNISAATYNWLDVNAVSGNNYYRIRSISLDGEVKYSKVVKVFIGKGDAVISVYPNPVIDGVINLQLTNMAKGNYTVNLINNIGQVVQSQKVSHSGGSATETISISKSVPRGTYQLEIVSPDNSRITNQLIY